MCGKSCLGVALHIAEVVLSKALGKQYHFSLQSIYFPLAVGIYFNWAFQRKPSVSQWSHLQWLGTGGATWAAAPREGCEPSALLHGEWNCSLCLLIPLLTSSSEQLLCEGLCFTQVGKETFCLVWSRAEHSQEIRVDLLVSSEGFWTVGTNLSGVWSKCLCEGFHVPPLLLEPVP